MGSLAASRIDVHRTRLLNTIRTAPNAASTSGDRVRASQELAGRRYTLRQVSDCILLRNRARRNRHLLNLLDEPGRWISWRSNNAFFQNRQGNARGALLKQDALKVAGSLIFLNVRPWCPKNRYDADNTVSCVALRLARPHCRAFAGRERRLGILQHKER